MATDENPPEAPVQGRVPALTVHFRGLCVFVIDRKTYECCVLLPDPSRVREVKLCRHWPVMSLLDYQVRALPKDFKQPALVIPGKPGSAPSGYGGRVALQPVPLRRRDLWIQGSTEEGVHLQSDGEEDFSHILSTKDLSDMEEISARYCKKQRPSKKIATRIRLTSGILAVTDLVPVDDWELAEFGHDDAPGTSIRFAREVKLEYFTKRADQVVLGTRRFGAAFTDTFILRWGSSVAISNVCTVTDSYSQGGVAYEGDKTDDGWDALAYHSLLPADPKRPKRVPRKRKQARIGAEACPPARAILGA